MRISVGSSASTSTASSEPKTQTDRHLRLQFEYTTQVDFSPAVGRHNLLLRCLPAKEAFQRVCREDFSISEGFVARESHDGLGNRIVTTHTGEMHRQVKYSCRGVVETTTYCLPDSNPHPMFSQASRLTAVTRDMDCLLPPLTGDRLKDSLQIAHAVHQHIVYTPGVTGMLTTAEDVFRHRKGVCQDYAHLMIALCRRAGISARYVCGLMQGEGQTHAWVEVHDGQCWYALDPTNDMAVATGYIKLAHGRDASDCPVNRGVYLGVSQEHTHIYVMVKEI